MMGVKILELRRSSRLRSGGVGFEAARTEVSWALKAQETRKPQERTMRTRDLLDRDAASQVMSLPPMESSVKEKAAVMVSDVEPDSRRRQSQ